MFSNFMRQFQEVQKKMLKNQEELRSVKLEGEAAGSAVKLTISGEGKLLQVKLSPSIMEDLELLEDAFVAAYQDAWAQLQIKREESMKDLKIPAGLEKLF